jgi:AmpD protein
VTANFSTPAEWHAEFGVERDIRSVVWHSMECSMDQALERWNDPTASASAHLAILRDGSVVLTVPLDNIAWHAGTDASIGRTAFWQRTNINPFSVGIELEGFAATGFTPRQVRAARRVADWLTARYHIPREHTRDQIDGHHMHSELSNQRHDPGPTFSWRAVL